MYFCVVLRIVCFVTFPVLFVCTCVLNNCHRVATRLQLNISYHIISYHIKDKEIEIQENKALRRLFGSKKGVTREMRKIHSKELHRFQF